MGRSSTGYARSTRWPVDIIADGVERTLDAASALVGEEAERDSVIERLAQLGTQDAQRQGAAAHRGREDGHGRRRDRRLIARQQSDRGAQEAVARLFIRRPIAECSAVGLKK